jgi:hypothetical protein
MACTQHLTVPVAAAVEGHLMLIKSLVVARSTIADCFALEFDLANATLTLTANVIRNLDQVQNILLQVCQYAFSRLNSRTLT